MTRLIVSVLIDSTCPEKD